MLGFCSLKFSSKSGILSKNAFFHKFSKKRYTLNVFWFSWKLVSRLIRLCWFQKSNRFCSGRPHSRADTFSSTFYNLFCRNTVFWQKLQRKKNLAWNHIKKCSRMILVMTLQHACSGSLSYLKFNLYQLMTATSGRGVTWYRITVYFRCQVFQ